MLKRTEGPAFVATLGMLAAVTATAIDISIPAQPTIAQGFGVALSAGGALVTAYLLGFGVGQMFWGLLADRFGRLPPLYVSLGCFVLASVVCAVTESFVLLLVARGVQGVMGSAAPVIARAIARDQGGGVRSAKLLSTMTVIVGLAPLLAPSIGSGLLTLFAWPAIFWFLATFGAVALVCAVLVVPETLRVADRGALSLPRILAGAATLFRSADFVGGVAVTSSIFFGYAALLATGAAVAAARYDVPAEAFGPIFAIAAAAFLVGSTTARALAGRFGIERVLICGGILAASVGVAMLALTAAEPSLPLLWAGVSAYVAAFGALMPAGTAKALEPAGGMAGLGSSLIGTTNMLAGVMGSVLAVHLFDGSHRGLTIVMAGGALLAATAVLVALLRRRR
ncbi:MAG: MFS transporter [Alphaproteobacteria bacterium]